MTDPVLSVRDLVVEFDTQGGVVQAVNGVSFDLFPGEILGVVGESGSGKSVTVLSILRLLPHPPARIVKGRVEYRGRNLLELGERELAHIRGRDIGMVFQDPMTSLNPVKKVGWQIAEALRTHDPNLSRGSALSKAVDLLRKVEVPDAEQRAQQYPHEFSGGMRQRAMIGLAIANDPGILIADEPTTALDVTVQAQVLSVLKDAQRLTGAATVLITHDLGLVGTLAERVLVMYGGRIIEQGPVGAVFRDPRHPYTLGLIGSSPRLKASRKRLVPIEGQPPNMVRPPSGCTFHPRCELSGGRRVCVDTEPPLMPVGDRHASRCHFTDEMPQFRDRIAARAEGERG